MEEAVGLGREAGKDLALGPLEVLLHALGDLLLVAAGLVEAREPALGKHVVGRLGGERDGRGRRLWAGARGGLVVLLGLVGGLLGPELVLVAAAEQVGVDGLGGRLEVERGDPPERVGLAHEAADLAEAGPAELVDLVGLFGDVGTDAGVELGGRDREACVVVEMVSSQSGS